MRSRDRLDASTRLREFWLPRPHARPARPLSPSAPSVPPSGPAPAPAAGTTDSAPPVVAPRSLGPCAAQSHARTRLSAAGRCAVCRGRPFPRGRLFVPSRGVRHGHVPAPVLCQTPALVRGYHHPCLGRSFPRDYLFVRSRGVHVLVPVLGQTPASVREEQPRAAVPVCQTVHPYLGHLRAACVSHLNTRQKSGHRQVSQADVRHVLVLLWPRFGGKGEAVTGLVWYAATAVVG